MTSYIPTLTDFDCASPGCGARKGWRCTYTGYLIGHPRRRSLVLTAFNRKIAAAKTAEWRDTLATARAEFVAQAQTLVAVAA